MDSKTFEALLADAQTYRAAVPALLTQTSHQAVQEAIRERKEFKMRLEEQMSLYAHEVAERRAWKKALEIAGGYQSIDTETLTCKKFDLIREEKENRFTGSSGTSQ